MKTSPAVLFLCIGLVLAPAAAAQSLDETIATALRDAAADSDALGTWGSSVSVQQPARTHYELGAVVDVRQPDAAGVKVLAVTPGGAADRMRLRAGDRIAAINGNRLAAAADPARLLQATLGASNGKLQVEALRGGQPLRLAGAADVIGTPAYRLTVGEPASGACGFVTELYQPPRSQNLFPAAITRIDGRSTPPRRTNRHRVAQGQHVVTVADDIPARYVTSAQAREIARMKKFEFAPTYKSLVIDIQPNTSYRIGVRLLTDKLDPESIRANAYWEPVVWQTAVQPCD